MGLPQKMLKVGDRVVGGGPLEKVEDVVLRHGPEP